MDKHSSQTIGEAARLARVTVRTLHHYDAIGLLCPSHRSQGEYRLYTRSDLERLHQIRLYRELDMPLREIQRLLDDPKFDARAALMIHRDRLSQKAADAQLLIETIDRILEGAGDMNEEDMFNGFQQEKHAQEAEQRWGNSEAYRVASKRTKKYSAKDMQRIKAEHGELMERFAEVMAEGHRPDSALAMDCAEQVRLHMDCCYYPLSRQAHLELGRMYMGDARFMKGYEDLAEGLTGYLVASIEANAARET